MPVPVHVFQLDERDDVCLPFAQIQKKSPLNVNKWRLSGENVDSHQEVI